jgi:hypothetical protein
MSKVERNRRMSMMRMLKLKKSLVQLTDPDEIIYQLFISIKTKIYIILLYQIMNDVHYFQFFLKPKQ